MEAWKQINEALTAAFPKEIEKEIPQTKKKYENIRREAMVDIRKYKESIRGTGNSY